MKLSGAQAIVKALELEGVEVVFGYPGAAICPFYDALMESKISRYSPGMNRELPMPPADMPEQREGLVCVLPHQDREQPTLLQALLTHTWTQYRWWPSPGRLIRS